VTHYLAAVLTDLDPQLDGLPLGIPAGILGKVKNDHSGCRQLL